jgi:hypothetical protein
MRGATIKTEFQMILKYHKNPSISHWTVFYDMAVPCRQAGGDKYDEANSRFLAILRTRLKLLN